MSRAPLSLCWGDPRHPAALTLAAIEAFGGPPRYVTAWMRLAEFRDDPRGRRSRGNALYVKRRPGP